MTTLGEALAFARQRIDRLDARLLLQYATGCSHADLLARPEMPVIGPAGEQFVAWVERRAAGEPLAYLLGEAEFRGRVFQVSPAVLIPRPETEVLIELALEVLAGRAAADVVDLGTGSGIVAVSLALECPVATVSAVDLSPGALAVARNNAGRLGAKVDFHEGDWFAPLAGRRFDLIVSNPPYVAEGDPHLELNGLPHEPRVALTDQGRLIATYALCGFANFSSIAIQIGGIGGLAPERRSDLARFGLRAVLGGTIATLMTATIAGVLSHFG